jgi:Tfp pilus assembly protein FimT
MIELLVVLAIIFCVIAVALPNTLHMVANFRARNSMSGMSGTIQRCRSIAISKNTTMTMHFGTTGGQPVAYVQDASQEASLDSALAEDTIGNGVVRYATPTGASAPTALSSTQLWGSSLSDPNTTEVSFNSRGLPCVYDIAGKTCATEKGFVYYFTYQPPFGDNGWAAVSVSPAGRVKTWLWDGSSWIN